MNLRKTLATLTLTFAVLVAVAAPAWAGSPHFVGAPTVTRAGDTLTVSGKEAGLGDETQIVVNATTTAACLNPGEQFPQAANKETVSADVTVPVQSGKADFSLVLSPVFQPKCSPPMSVVFGDVTVTDVTNGLTATVVGPF